MRKFKSVLGNGRTHSIHLILLIALIMLPGIIQGQSLEFQRTILSEKSGRHPLFIDLNNDGIKEILFTISAQNNHEITAFIAPNWEPAVICKIKYSSCDEITGDIDNDGDLDIIGRYLDGNDEGMVFWLENPSPESKALESEWNLHIIGPAEYIKEFDIADIDKNGQPDIIARAENWLYVFFQVIPDKWQVRQDPIHRHDGLAIGDLDMDGDQDIVLNGYWLEMPENPFNSVWIMHIIDKRWFLQYEVPGTDNNCKVEVSDVNHDGYPDVIFSNAETSGHPVLWYEGSKNVSNPDDWKIHVIGEVDWCHSLRAGDMDNDGDIDIVTGELIQTHDYFAREALHPLIVFINNGQEPWEFITLSNEGCYGAGISDIDGDGDMDIITPKNYNTGPLQLWINKLK